MLFKSTVQSSTLGLLERLSKDEILKDFVLVGGTALALQIGHRISVDLDFFSNLPFEQDKLVDYLHRNYQFELDYIAKNTIKGEIDGVQIDCISHQYPWISSFVTDENFRLAGAPDIAAMKLNAISGNGTRLKDFIDIAFLSTKMTLNEMLGYYQKKYNSNPIIPLKAITYFDEIDYNEPIKMVEGLLFKWKNIEKRLIDMQKEPNHIFQTKP
jgi:hypothetical protein